MTFKQIEYFQLVCAKGNISAAADEVFVSRSVISRAIAELEGEFQTKLFVRLKSGVVLTESGRILARLFEEYTSAYDVTKKRIDILHDKHDTNILRLGVTPTNAYRVYIQYFLGFLKAHPQIQIITNEYNALEASKCLLDGTVEAFFTPARIMDYNVFDKVDLYNTQIALGVSSNSPLSAKSALGITDILDLPLGCLNAPVPIESILKSSFASFGKVPNVVIRTSDHRLLLELTQKGELYSILPDDMILNWVGVEAIPLDFFPASTHRLVWNKAVPHNEAFDSFLKYIKHYV